MVSENNLQWLGVRLDCSESKLAKTCDRWKVTTALLVVNFKFFLLCCQISFKEIKHYCMMFRWHEICSVINIWHWHLSLNLLFQKQNVIIYRSFSKNSFDFQFSHLIPVFFTLYKFWPFISNCCHVFRKVLGNNWLTMFFFSWLHFKIITTHTDIEIWIDCKEVVLAHYNP